MKADQSLSAIFRQLRPTLPQPYTANSHLRLLSQSAPLRHPSFSRPSTTPKGDIPQLSFPLRSFQIRSVSDTRSAPSSAVAHSQASPSNAEPSPEGEPAYELTFTCKPCKHRSTHRVTKQGYHKGSVLIKCPQCSNRHIMSDHLKMFGDQSYTIEDLMRQKGQLVKRGTLGGNGDIEFWDDGSPTKKNMVENMS